MRTFFFSRYLVAPAGSSPNWQNVRTSRVPIKHCLGVSMAC